jgi:hypothetical protein
MHDPDAISVAAFDDDPRPLPSSVVAEPRPADRPRPDPSTHSGTDPIAVVVVDSSPEPTSPAQHPSPALPALAFDVCLFDLERASFLVIYSAGTPLSALKPRTVSIPATEADSPVTSIAIHVRSIGDLQPVPCHTFRFPRDVRGERLTLRFADPGDSSSLLIEYDSSGRENGARVELRPCRADG